MRARCEVGARGFSYRPQPVYLLFASPTILWITVPGYRGHRLQCDRSCLWRASHAGSAGGAWVKRVLFVGVRRTFAKYSYRVYLFDFLPTVFVSPKRELFDATI
jgi:hypothetical protein